MTESLKLRFEVYKGDIIWTLEPPLRPNWRRVELARDPRAFRVPNTARPILLERLLCRLEVLQFMPETPQPFRRAIFLYVHSLWITIGQLFEPNWSLLWFLHGQSYKHWRNEGATRKSHWCVYWEAENGFRMYFPVWLPPALSSI